MLQSMDCKESTVTGRLNDNNNNACLLSLRYEIPHFAVYSNTNFRKDYESYWG